MRVESCDERCGRTAMMTGSDIWVLRNPGGAELIASVGSSPSCGAGACTHVVVCREMLLVVGRHSMDDASDGIFGKQTGRVRAGWSRVEGGGGAVNEELLHSVRGGARVGVQARTSEWHRVLKAILRGRRRVSVLAAQR